MLLWNAVKDWTTSYITLYYADDKAVKDDALLRGWIDELVQAGKVSWLSTFDYTISKLVDVCASTIFIGSVEHCAVNFPQRTIMQFTPSYRISSLR
jgi:arachidonate 15-lipoxygenase